MRRFAVSVVVAICMLTLGPAGANHLTQECGGGALVIVDDAPSPLPSPFAQCFIDLNCAAGTYCTWQVTVTGSGLGQVTRARIELDQAVIAECGDALLECTDAIGLGLDGQPDGRPTRIWCYTEGNAVDARVDCRATANPH